LRGVRVRRHVEAAFETAALIYKRECSLDITPAPWVGPKRFRVVGDVLVAFALVIPDPDGRQVLEHLWTCAQQRRSGVATDLVRELVGALGTPLLVYHVVSEAGEALATSAERLGS